VVPILNIRISLQVLYVIMMYISAFPIAITIRNSNVYEERRLGIYTNDPGYDHTAAKTPKKAGVFSWMKNQITAPTNESSRRYFVQQQLRAQLAHDLWWLGLAIFLIMIVEGNSFESNPAVYSVFNVIFETVSGKSRQFMPLGHMY
jgi:Trk-type K+ transport system membrane component